jgi:hypothetical protein
MLSESDHNHFDSTAPKLRVSLYYEYEFAMRSKTAVQPTLLPVWNPPTFADP